MVEERRFDMFQLVFLVVKMKKKLSLLDIYLSYNILMVELNQHYACIMTLL